MMNISFTGSYDECREDAMKLFGFARPFVKEMDEETVRKIEEIAKDQPVTTTFSAVLDPLTTEQKQTVLTDTPEIKQIVLNCASIAEEPAQTEEPKAEEPAPAEEPKAEEKITLSPGEVATITLVAARARMNDLRTKFGAMAVKGVLKEIGFPKFTDVPEEKYPELMVLCDAAEKGYAAAAEA